MLCTRKLGNRLIKGSSTIGRNLEPWHDIPSDRSLYLNGAQRRLRQQEIKTAGRCSSQTRADVKLFPLFWHSTAFVFYHAHVVIKSDRIMSGTSIVKLHLQVFFAITDGSSRERRRVHCIVTCFLWRREEANTTLLHSLLPHWTAVAGAHSEGAELVCAVRPNAACSHVWSQRPMSFLTFALTALWLYYERNWFSSVINWFIID